jgi:hypothetical protein
MGSYYLEKFNLALKPATTHLFLAEGEAEAVFMDVYLGLRGADPETTTVLCFRGLGNVASHVASIVKLIEKDRAGVGSLRGVGVLTDAENDPAARIDAAIHMANSLGFLHPAKDIRAQQKCERDGRRFAVSLSPANDQLGRIEHLVLQEVSTYEGFACLEPAFECLENLSGTAVDAKAKVQMFISAGANSSLAGIHRAFSAKILDPMALAYAAHRTMIDYALEA